MRGGRISFLRGADWLTPERIRRIAIVCAGAQLAMLAVFWRLQILGLFTETVGAPFGQDFSNYWAGAQLAMHGHAATAYDVKAFLDYEHRHIAPFPGFRWYAYPPIALLLSAPLALLPYIPAYAIWLVGGTGLCALLFSRFLRWPMAVLATLATPVMFANAATGQNGQFTAALLAGGLILLDRRPILSGVLFGMLIYKPHFGVLIPLALAADRRWQTILSAFVTVAVLTGMSVLLFGWDAWAAYLHSAPLKMNQLIVNQGQSPDPGLLGKGTQFGWHRMPTVFAAFRQAGATSTVAYGAQAVSAAAAMFVTAMIWWRRARWEVKAAALILATMLVTPYAWDYDLIVVAFSIVWLWQDAARVQFLPFEKLVLGGTMAMMMIFAPVARISGVQIAPVMMWLALAFACRHSRYPSGEATQPGAQRGLPAPSA